MKYTIFWAILLLAATLFGTASALEQADTEPDLVLSLATPKDSYALGEIVPITFGLTNVSKKDLAILDFFGIGTGFLTVHISSDGESYASYEAGWGTIDVNWARTPVKSGEQLTSDETILWTRKGHASKFTFTEAGVYYLKAKYNTTIEGAEKNVVVESKPVRIVISEPEGEDLEVWNKIKNNGDFAYLLHRQEVRIPNYKPEDRLKFQQSIEQIIADHPNSSYAAALRKSLVAFLEREERLKSEQEKMKKAQ